MKRIKLYPWKRLLSLLLCICICLGSLPVMLASAAGSATGMGLSENNPLEIDTAEKLYEFASNYNDGSIYQKLDVAKDAYLYIHLTADINLHPYSGGEGWLPIGSGNGGNTDFKGSFDGGGFTVSGLGINRRDGDTEGADNQGLFGIVAAGSTVKNVALADASVSGGNRVGLLAGANRGTIRNCSVNGTAAGTGNAGLIAGYNQGTIETCLTLGDVSGDNAGGITGNSDGTVENCAALARSVNGSTYSDRILPGQGTVRSCISWNGAAAADVYASGRSLEELKTAAVWPETFKADPWHYSEGTIPSLSAQGGAFPVYITGLTGLGTSEDPYKIGSFDDLLLFAKEVNSGNGFAGLTVKLTSDITMPAGGNWEPIENFAGIFDGGNHRITGLTINRPDQPGVGLFGKTSQSHDAAVRSLCLIDCDVTGYSQVGGIVGEGHGITITNCYVSGKVTATYKDAAGIVGTAFDSTVAGCLSKANVNSLWGAAGIQSYMEGGMVSDCYSTGTIHTVQASSLAGIVAHMETYASTVARCYTTAILIADGAKRSGMHEGVGGVVGVTSGVVQDAIALNKRITAKSADNVGRVGGKTVSTVAGEPLFEGSASWIMMPVNDGVRNDSTGQSYSAAQFKEPERWQAFQDSALWTYSGGGSLPFLKGIPADLQSGAWPEDLKDAYEELYTKVTPDGSGVYHITDPAQLAWLAVNAAPADLKGKTISIEKSFSLENYKTGMGWTPIGNSKTAIENLTVKGGGNTISGLTIRCETGGTEYLGLFGNLYRPTIENLIVRVDIAVNSSSINTTQGLVYVGGLCGKIESGRVTNCISEGEIRMTGRGIASHIAGGLIGYVNNELERYPKDNPMNSIPEIALPVVTGCSNRADVTAAGGTCDVGGLAGKLEGELHQCFNSGRITTEQGSAGGIVGFLSVSQRIYWQAKSFDSETMDCLSDAYNTGDVSGTKAGGIIGYVFYPHEVDRSVGQHAYVSRVYNTGSIRMEVGEDSEPASGGLIGVLWIDQSRGSRPDTKPFYFHLTSAYSLGLSVTSDKEDADSLLGKIRGGGAANVILSGYRWEGLAVTAGGKSVNVLQGTALNMAEIKSYLSNFYLWPVNHWKTQSGKLPILINAAGAQSGDYPLYLALADGGNQSIGIGSSEELKYAAANWPINTPNLHLYLENDIDMAGITGYAPFQGFAGTFDGKGHAIRNLTIEQNTNFAGLFGELSKTGIVKDLAMIDCSVKGQSYVGMIAGEAQGRIERCAVYRSAESLAKNPESGWQVTAAGGYAGGLVGHLRIPSDDVATGIVDSYAAVNVRALGDYAGGLIGLVGNYADTKKAKVTRCFASGWVAAGGDSAGGLIGFTNDAEVEDLIALGGLTVSEPNKAAGRVVGTTRPEWDILTRLSAWDEMLTLGDDKNAANGTGMTAAELADPEAWSRFSTGAWDLADGGTPRLKSLLCEQENLLPHDGDSLNLRKDGTTFLIGNGQDLLIMGRLVGLDLKPFKSAAYRMDADIDLSGLLGDGHTLWTPIGPFSGLFDGSYHRIDGFTPLVTEACKGIGLFDRIEEGGTVRNLTVSGTLKGRLNGSAYAGFIVARLSGSVVEVTTEGLIALTGGLAVGGITGQLLPNSDLRYCTNRADFEVGNLMTAGGIVGICGNGLRVTNCVNEGNLFTVADRTAFSNPVGGIVGTVLGGTIKSCRNAGGVASATAGGIAGSIQYESTVEQCVSTGPVSGILYGSGSIAGGIAGIMEASAVKNCYSTGPVQVNNKETTYAGGIAGKMSGGSLSSCYATGKIEGGVHEAFDPFNIGYAGGIVGYLEQNRNGAKGEIKNVAALNASVTGDARGAVGNHDKDFTGSQLHAWDGLKDSQGDSAIPVDGWTVKERVWEQGYWSADIGLDFDTVWQKVIQQNAVEVLLPLLRDVSDQNGRLPDHLKRFIRDPLTVELKLKASETHLLYTGNSRSVFFEATVEGVLSDRRLIWSHDADKKVEVRQLSQTEYYASFPDDYQGTMKMTVALKEAPDITAEVTITVDGPVNAALPDILVQPKDTPTVVGKPARLTVEAESPDGGTLTYQWYRSDVAGEDGTAIDKATEFSYEAPAEQTEIAYYYCIVTNTIPDGEGVGKTTATTRSDTAQVTVTKDAQQALTIVGGNRTATYGDEAFQLGTNGGSGSGKVTWKSDRPELVAVDQDGKVTILGATPEQKPATITATKEGDSRYAPSSAHITVTVNKATLTVRPDDNTRAYGQPNPAFTCTITGFVNNEDASVLKKQPVASCEADEKTPAGTPVITASGGEADNYTFDYQVGTLTITQAGQEPLAFRDGNQYNKTYGDKAFQLILTGGSGNGAVKWESSDESVAAVDQDGKVTVLKTGEARITATKAAAGNYAEAQATAVVKVGKATLTVTAANAEKSYGEENPAFTYRFAGFVNGDTAEDLESLPVLTADADKTTGVGRYAIRLTGGEDSNYAYVLTDGELEITPRPVTIKADDKEMTEGGAIPELTWTVTEEGSLLKGDTLEGSLKADGSGVGSHPIIENLPFANPNYAVTFLPGTLTVKEKPKDPSAPQTGDDFPIWPLWLSALSMGGVLFASGRRRKRSK